MKPLTVEELVELLNDEISKGNGGKVVMVSDDEECNGYHCLWNLYPIDDGIPFVYKEYGRWKNAQTILIS